MPNIFKSGFTLIELLIVVSVIGILAGITLVLINPIAIQNRTRDGVVISSMNKLIIGYAAYNTVYGSYPDANDPDCDGPSDYTGCPVTKDLSNLATWQQNQSARHWFRLEGLPVQRRSYTDGDDSPGNFQYRQNASRTCLISHSYSSQALYLWRSDLPRLQYCTYSGLSTSPGVDACAQSPDWVRMSNCTNL